MGNWQERINAEINRRESQAGMAAQKPVGISKLSYEERMKIEGDAAIRRLKPEELRALGLLDRLGVEHMLEEIRDEVWGGHGNISQEEFAFEAWVGKDLCLEFKYSYPKPKWTHVYDRKFGRHKVVHGGSSNTPEYGMPNASWSETKLGFYEAESGYKVIERYATDEGGEYLQIRIKKDTYGFVLELPHSNKLKLNPQLLDETGAKKFIETNLLDDCIERKKNKSLPTDILERVRHNEIIIQQAIKEKRRFYFDENGNEVGSSLGLVQVWR